jgi:hypothetical protein
MSLGRSLYIATYFGSFVPNTLFLITIQKSETSLSVAELSVPISIPSIPATYKFFQTFPSGSFRGGSTTNNFDVDDS